MLPSGPPFRREPAFDDAGIAAAGHNARAVWSAESAAERDRLLRMPAAERLAALDDEATRQLLTAGHRAEVRASLAPAPDGWERPRVAWTVERRRLAVMHGLRPAAVAGIITAASLPFGVSAWRDGLGLGDALAVFLASGRGLAGLAVAVLAITVLARMVGRLSSPEGLAGSVVAAFAAGVVAVAVSRGLFS